MKEILGSRSPKLRLLKKKNKPGAQKINEPGTQKINEPEAQEMLLAVYTAGWPFL